MNDVETSGVDAALRFADGHLWFSGVAVALVIAAMLWGHRARRRALAALGDAVLLAPLLASVSHNGRVVARVSVVLASLALVGGLLRPQYGGTAEIVRASGLDIVLAVDYSKSMLVQDVYPSRNARLEAELQHFLDAADRLGDRVGVVVFAGDARGLPVTRDARLLKLYLQHADPRTEEPGGTAIGKALDLGLKLLVDARARGTEDDVQGRQVLVLLTDGEDHGSRPLELAARAKQLGIRIYTVGIGSTSGEPVPKFNEAGEPDGFVTDEAGNFVLTRLAPDPLKALAEQTGGAYVQVDNERFGLDDVRARLEADATEHRVDKVVMHRKEGFMWPVALALALLCVAIGAPDRRREVRDAR